MTSTLLIRLDDTLHSTDSRSGDPFNFATVVERGETRAHTGVRPISRNDMSWKDHRSHQH